MVINQDVLFDVFNLKVNNFSVGTLGVASTNSTDGVLTFLSESKYSYVINENKDIKAVFVSNVESCILRDDVLPIFVDDPKWYFFTLLNHQARCRNREKTIISDTAIIHQSAVISEKGVTIGNRVTIEPNVTIYPDVIIEDDVIIRAGAVIGVDGFEHKRTSKGIVSVLHDGSVLIKRGAEIGVNSNIVKGFSYRQTVVGEESKIDALVHYAHGVQCGKGCMIVASASIAGHVTIGDNVWIGPSASIANRLTIGSEAFVTFGSVVVRNVAPGQKVTGNFAIPHEKFLINYKDSMK